jgi:hypothetical protein
MLEFEECGCSHRCEWSVRTTEDRECSSERSEEVLTSGIGPAVVVLRCCLEGSQQAYGALFFRICPYLKGDEEVWVELEKG